MKTKLPCPTLCALLALALCATPALAQDEPLIDDGTTTTPPPAPPPPPSPPPQPKPQPRPAPKAAPARATAEANTPRSQKDITDTDHDMVVGSIGLQIVYHGLIAGRVAGTTAVAPPGGTQQSTDSGIKDDSIIANSQAHMGMRYWFTRTIGLDGGLAMFVGKPAQDDADTQVGFGLFAGVPFALGVYRHVVMFAGPYVGFGLAHLGSDTTQWLLSLKGAAGIELSLGFIDIPRISVVGGFAFGLRVYNDSNETEIVFANDNGFSLNSLFEGNVGLIFYL